jgi:hypothetical protein
MKLPAPDPSHTHAEIHMSYSNHRASKAYDGPHVAEDSFSSKLSQMKGGSLDL